MHVPFSYRDTGSAIHRLNAFVMPLWCAAMLVAALLLSHPVALVAVLLATIPVAVAARVTHQWVNVMRYVAWMGLAIVAINAVVSTQGSHVLLEAGFRLPLLGTPRLTLEALAFGGAMAVRLSAIISAFTLLNLCLHPDDAMRAAIKLRLPYRSVLVTSLSTRFVPVLLSDASLISEVQKSRGLDFEHGGPVQRIRNYGALILPLLSNSLDRATQVSEALEARGYGAGIRRTFYRDPSPAREGILALLLLGGAIAVTIAMRVNGIDSFTYYPSIGAATMHGAELIGLGVLVGLLLSPIPLAAARRRRTRD